MSKGMRSVKKGGEKRGTLGGQKWWLLCVFLFFCFALSSSPAWAARQCQDGSTAGSGNICPEDPDPDTPLDDAEFVSQSIPSSLQTGQAVTVSVTFRNSGTTNWTSGLGYQLGSFNPQDNTTWGLSRVALPSSVPPGQNATFTFNITAPGAAGAYNFQWQMVHADGRFGAASDNSTIQVTAPPTDQAEFVSQSVPSTLVAGQSASVTVQMRNSGTTTWTSGSNYHLGSYNPFENTTWGMSRVELPGDVAPGQVAAFTFNVTAPSTAGSYNFQWQMVRDGVAWFGDASSNLSISVSSPTPPGDPSPSNPPPASPAESYSRTEEITYHDNTTNWVLGQVAQRTVDGLIAEATTFDATTALPLSVSEFGKLKQTLSHNTDGTLATTTDGNGNTTTYSNWKRGIPQSISFADATSKSAEVDDHGWITSVTDENGYQTQQTYDAMGRLATIVWPSDNAEAWNTTSQVFEPVAGDEYGIPSGHWRQTIATGNARKVTYYDVLWRALLTREYDAADEANTVRFTRFAYDHDGRTLFSSYPGTTDALSAGVWTEYDALGRPTSVSQDSEHGLLTTVTEYLVGFQTRLTNPRGQQSTTRYMTYDQPSVDWPVVINHPESASTEIMRDHFGKPLSITRRNSDGTVWLTRSYVYAWDQTLCKAIEPETGASVYFNDAAGNLSWSASGISAPSTTDCGFEAAQGSGRVVARTYDARNRLLTLSFPDGHGNQTWSYTPDGLPGTVAVSNPDGADPVATTYQYNRRRLLAGETATIGGMSLGISYAYDGNGAISGQTYPSGLTVDYAPNALGQPTQASGFASGVSYYPNGAIKQFAYANGITHTLAQNARQLPARSSDGVVLDLAYLFDPNGNVEQITDYVDGHQNRNMSYDGLDRLTQATSNIFGIASYAYDALDNLVRVQLGGGNHARDHAYCYDAQWHLTNVKTSNCDGATVVGLLYDAQGNLANKNGQLYTFDYGNRLREVANKERYAYDGLGRRVLSCTGAACAYQQYSQAGQPLYVHDNRSGLQSERIYLGGSLVAIREVAVGGGATTVKFQHTDALGSPIAVSDAAGAVIQTSDYEPFGQLLNRPLTDGPGFTGHVQDAATGLTYMQQRYYDPGLGAFLSVDPVTAYSNPNGAFNRYWYASNNPYRFTDPDGRQSVQEMIDSGAEGCGAVSCAGWAILSAAWTMTGAEPLSQVSDKGWSNVSASEQFGAAAAVVGVLPVGRVAGRLAQGVTEAAVGAEAAAGIAKGTHVVYQGIDKAGDVRYVGITSRDVATRGAEHVAGGGGKAGLIYQAVEGEQGLTKQQARVMEQRMINQHGLEKNGGQLLNKINSISPKYWSDYGITP
ncbi:RHS repeat domain-containing protein [Xanthomonas oryzae]|uniref:RHS repeat domain-containing protein n=1 Tax=Xanthomonas oryzae TaxID=347 RepID=UPI003D17C9D8